MTACTRSALAMLTDFFSSDDIEATARRTGFVKRASKMTGKLFLALFTFGSWSEAQTSLAQWAAKVTQVVEQVEVSPEAIHQRMNQRALVFLQEMIRQALAKVQASNMCALMGSLPPFPRCISLTGAVLACQTVWLICFPAREGVRPKPEPKCKRCGTIKAVCLAIAH